MPTKTKKARVRHGLSGTPTYKAWAAMKQRITNPNHPKFHHYGGRGITIEDPRWFEFVHFFADMGVKPEGRSLDRIDNERGYSKGNCRWATPREQNRNRRNNVLLAYDGKTQTITQWADELGVNISTIWMRINHGWPTSEVLGRPVDQTASNSVRLRPDDVHAIRRLRGENAREVGRRFGVGFSTVYAIWGNRTWSHLPQESDPLNN